MTPAALDGIQVLELGAVYECFCGEGGEGEACERVRQLLLKILGIVKPVARMVRNCKQDGRIQILAWSLRLARNRALHFGS